MRLTLVAAVAENGVIGAGGDLPWRLPSDLRRFKRLTLGHHMIMGRRTWESIGRALPGRTTIVVTRHPRELPEGVLQAGSFAAAMALAERAGESEAFVVGGAEIYRLALPQADRLVLTRVHATVAGDTHFPTWESGEWRLLHSETPTDRSDGELPTTFEIWERRPA